MASLFIVLGVLFVLSFVPLVVLLARSYLRYRGTRVVTCPATGDPSRVSLNARKAAFSSVTGGVELAVASCERWPEHKNCGQECVSESATAGPPRRPAEARG
jgi:hypothetical protein